MFVSLPDDAADAHAARSIPSPHALIQEMRIAVHAPFERWCAFHEPRSLARLLLPQALSRSGTAAITGFLCLPGSLVCSNTSRTHSMKACTRADRCFFCG